MRPTLRRLLLACSLLAATGCAEAPSTAQTDDASSDASSRPLDAGRDTESDGGDVSVDDSGGDDVSEPDADTGEPDAPCPDGDGDGVCDADDVCADGDDTRDNDDDGTPDDCDPCPLDPDDDADGDGLCANDDICPDGDDSLDADGDGRPNACDPCPLDDPDDRDGDGICDSDDDCPLGPDDRDRDEDGTPDACDPCPGDPGDDSDGDGSCDGIDTCPDGDDRVDGDGDGAPDACDPCPLDATDDTDGDGVCDGVDICELGDDGADTDGDGTPDACDDCDGDDRVDTDGDGAPDACDPCPLDAPDDPDDDGICTSDDVCLAGDDRLDDDDDGTADACDLCPGSDDRVDTDGDGVPNGCDDCEGGIDTDGDGVCDPDDPCPLDNPDDPDGDTVCTSEDICPDGPDDVDTDGDGVPDACDDCPLDDPDDTDGDGACDSADPCPLDNPDDPDGDTVCTSDDVCLDGDDREDADGDGIPDDCDLCRGTTLEDDDGDGICNDLDICPSGPDDVDTDGDGVPDACEALPGSYQYDRLELGGIGPLESVSFHPSGDYFVAVERYDRVLAYEVASGALTTFDLSSTDGTPYSTEVEFAPDGSYALITGYISLDDGGTRATLRRFDHARWIAGDADVIETIDEIPSRGMYESVSYRGDGPVPLLVARSERSPYTMHLDAYDDVAREAAFVVATATGAGCQDIAYAPNEFGGPGYLVVCGVNGYDAWYYTRVGGVWELRSDLGNNLLGNTSHVEAHPTAGYALAISWSADAVYRFSAGLMQDGADFDFSRRRLWNLAFDRAGARALVVGQYQSTTDGVFGSVFEFRHDERECTRPLSADCDLAEVAIPNFGSAPFNADNGTFMSDVAWRPGCDGGVIVTADTFPDRGMFITFEREGGLPCWP